MDRVACHPGGGYTLCGVVFPGRVRRGWPMYVAALALSVRDAHLWHRVLPLRIHLLRCLGQPGRAMWGTWQDRIPPSVVHSRQGVFVSKPTVGRLPLGAESGMIGELWH